MTEEALFHAALAIPPDQRAAYLAERCPDPAARRRVADLLAAHDRPAGPLDSPATGAFLSNPPVADAPGSPGTVIGPYKLLQPLDEGGMGEVWVADQERPVKRRVALKLIKPGMDSAQVLRRFEAERQALALMDHTNIAKVLDAGTSEQGRPYFVMELVKGVPITKYCDELHLSVRERLDLFVPVCQAIQHAHQKGVIHRDIKPSNVLVAMQDGKPVPKVIDFGVAKALHQRLTEQSMYTEIGAVLGTLEYMSPEQAELSALDVDTRADVYALGVLLYELLTGSTPLDRKRLRSAAFVEMLRIIKEEEPPRPSTRLTQSHDSLASLAAQRRTEPKRLAKEVRGELDWIVMKCLEKDRTRRYETASGLARDLQRHLADEAVEACPPSATYRVRKLVRRHKGPVLAAAAVVLALTGGIIGTTWGLVRADAARRAEADSAAAEKAAKETAQAREAETKAVLDFVENKVFAAARPKDPFGLLTSNRDLTLREAVETALPSVDTGFPGQPIIEARVRMTLGRSLLYLGEAKTAAQQFQAARTIYAKLYGADDPETLWSMHGLANSYAALYRHADATALYEQTLAGYKFKLSPDDPETLRAMDNLARSYWALRRYAEELKLRQESLAIRKAKVGVRDSGTVLNIGFLALTYKRLGRHAEAAKLFEELREWRETAPETTDYNPGDLEAFLQSHA
jgi:non-specific serine/threonine protein kinase/serine/threonine-protein kinase